MASTITFTDEAGAVTFSNGVPVPGDRFRKWEPYVSEVGAEAYRLGSGVRNFWQFREDYGARFSIEAIPRSKLNDAQRLLRWLQLGNAVQVNTGDASSNVYPSCTLAPGFDATKALVMSDQQMIEWTLSLDLINTADTPVAMLCLYPGGR